MKISANAIRSFNRQDELVQNDNWNIANNLGTLAERKFLKDVARYSYLEKVTRKDVNDYIRLQELIKS